MPCSVRIGQFAADNFRHVSGRNGRGTWCLRRARLPYASHRSCEPAAWVQPGLEVAGWRAKEPGAASRGGVFRERNLSMSIIRKVTLRRRCDPRRYRARPERAPCRARHLRATEWSWWSTPRTSTWRPSPSPTPRRDTHLGARLYLDRHAAPTRLGHGLHRRPRTRPHPPGRRHLRELPRGPPGPAARDGLRLPCSPSRFERRGDGLASLVAASFHHRPSLDALPDGVGRCAAAPHAHAAGRRQRGLPAQPRGLHPPGRPERMGPCWNSSGGPRAAISSSTQAPLAGHEAARVDIFAGAAALTLPDLDLAFSDHDGAALTVYLPAISLAASQTASYWIASNGGTYTSPSGQTQPDFSTLARGPPSPGPPPRFRRGDRRHRLPDAGEHRLRAQPAPNPPRRSTTWWSCTDRSRSSVATAWCRITRPACSTSTPPATSRLGRAGPGGVRGGRQRRPLYHRRVRGGPRQ